LECGRGITETEEHDNGFIETGGGDKCSLPAIIGVNKDVVVSPSDIDLSKVLGGTEFIKKRGNERERVCVLDRFGIKRAIILTRAKFPIFLSYEKESTCLWRFRQHNRSASKVFFDKFFHSKLFRWSQLISFDSFWFEVWFEFNMVIKFSVGQGNCLRGFL